MSLTTVHAAAILRRDPHDTFPLGGAVPGGLVFTVDLLHDPDLPPHLHEPLFRWALEYFDAHVDEQTGTNVHRLAGYALQHPNVATAEDTSVLMTLSALT